MNMVDILMAKQLAGGSGGGGGGGVLVVNAEVDMQAKKVVLDKTFNEIISAPMVVLPMEGGPGAPVLKLYLEHYESDYFNLIFASLGSTPQTFTFTTISADDYPFMSMG